MFTQKCMQHMHVSGYLCAQCCAQYHTCTLCKVAYVLLHLGTPENTHAYSCAHMHVLAVVCAHRAMLTDTYRHTSWHTHAQTHTHTRHIHAQHSPKPFWKESSQTSTACYHPPSKQHFTLCAFEVGIDSAVLKERLKIDCAGFLSPASYRTRAGGHKT